MLWIKFILLAGVVIVAGTKLARYGDIIAEKSGISRTLIGVVLLAAATSLPELVSSCTASFIGNVDLALGNLLGANMLNLLLIAIVDVVADKGAITYRLRSDHILTAGFIVIMLALVALWIGAGSVGINLGWASELVSSGKNLVSWASVIILGVYLLGVGTIFRYGRNTSSVAGSETASLYEGVSVVKALVRFLIVAAVIVLGGMALSRTADAISHRPLFGREIGGTFMGSTFLAVATTMPELVVSLAAVRIGAFDMAVGNLLGSVMFNTVIVFFADAAARNSFLFLAVSEKQIFTALFIIIASVVVMMGLVYRSQRAFLRLGWDGWIIVGLYLTWSISLFGLR